MGRIVGFGQLYLETAKDSEGNWLNGSSTNHLKVPKDAPVAQFWSIAVYDNETRCFVDTGVPPDRSSRDTIVKNSDGTVDLHFGPTAPDGKPESNWIQTLPSKGWFTCFRLYGPAPALLRPLLGAAGHRVGQVTPDHQRTKRCTGAAVDGRRAACGIGLDHEARRRRRAGDEASRGRGEPDRADHRQRDRQGHAGRD